MLRSLLDFLWTNIIYAEREARFLISHEYQKTYRTNDLQYFACIFKNRIGQGPELFASSLPIHNKSNSNEGVIIRRSLLLRF